MTEILQHPSIGPIRGRVSDGHLQFLGVKYASLKDRLAEAELVTDYGNEVVDATEIGPQVLSPAAACSVEYEFIQHTLPHPDFLISDLDGLHVNITTPKGAKDLPVMFFIHGGGFGGGSNAWPQYDFLRLVKLAVTLGKPFIGVAVNYRVGIPGFLTSKVLREAGYKPNNGIRDQRAALLWVKKNIAGFGGDPQRITVAGQSAGAVSAMLHLQSKEPLFDQVVIMSGSTLLMRPLPLEVTEAVYSQVTKALSLDGLAPELRVKHIIECPAAKLHELIPPGVPLLPAADDDIVREGLTYEKFDGDRGELEAVLPGAKWCRRALVGDCGSDAHIYYPAFEAKLSGIYQTFHRSLTATLGAEKTEEIEQAYSIVTDATDDETLRNILKWATDIGFYAPVKAIASGWPGQRYVYHINVTNPWEGAWKGEATHITDVVLLFQNYNEYLPPTHQAHAKSWAQDFITFVNGQEAFPSYKSEPQGAMVFGPPSTSSEFIVGDRPEDFGRRSSVLELTRGVGFDLLNTAWVELLSGQ